jgi:hypothetical protein
MPEPQRTPLPTHGQRQIYIEEDYDDARYSSSPSPSSSQFHKKQKTGTPILRGANYSVEEIKTILYCLFKEIPSADAFKQFQKEFPDSSRTKTSFSQKYQSVTKEIHEKTAPQAQKVDAQGHSNLLNDSPNLAYDFMKPIFISKDGKFYYVMAKAHFKSIASGFNCMFLVSVS